MTHAQKARSRSAWPTCSRSNATKVRWSGQRMAASPASRARADIDPRALLGVALVTGSRGLARERHRVTASDQGAGGEAAVNTNPRRWVLLAVRQGWSVLRMGHSSPSDRDVPGYRREGGLGPVFLTLPAHRLARRVLRLEPRLRRPAAIGRVRPLRHDALQPHAADVIEHGRAVVRQMFNEPDGVLGSADQSGEPPLALDQRQVAQVVTVDAGSGRRRTAPPHGPGFGSAARGSPTSRRRGRSPPRRRSGTSAP